MIYLLIICIIIIGFLGYKLKQRHDIDESALQEYQDRRAKLISELDSTSKQVEAIRSKWLDQTIKYNTAKQDTDNEYAKLQKYTEALAGAQKAYEDAINIKTEDINERMRQRQEELDAAFESRKQLLEAQYENAQREYDNNVQILASQASQQISEIEAKVKEYQDAEQFERERFESLRKPLMQYELEKQQRLYYTIQLPEEYQEDINFLLTTVAAKVQHPDIIAKLVWAEYVKPNLDNTFKRIGITADAGIYKLTNLDSGKAYIGKSTDVKKRIADHFKSSIGIRNIADQAVHHEILKTGFWNWTIEVITYCDKDKLSELEKYYIDFFKTKDFGYNKIL